MAETNRLLRWLERTHPRDHARLSGRLDAVGLIGSQVLFAPGDPIRDVYFPESSVLAVVRRMPSGHVAGLLTTGREGMVGIVAAFGGETATAQCVVLIAGASRCLAIGEFRVALAHSAALRDAVHRYNRFLLARLGQMPVCLRWHSIEQRCARWLLTCADRIRTTEFALTQQRLATMAGARRTGVTAAEGAFQRAGLVRYRRGRVTILDRPGLEATACTCYRADGDLLEELLPTG